MKVPISLESKGSWSREGLPNKDLAQLVENGNKVIAETRNKRVGCKALAN